MDQPPSSNNEPLLNSPFPNNPVLNNRLPHSPSSPRDRESLVDRHDVQTLFAGLALLMLILAIWSTASALGAARPLLPPIEQHNNSPAGFAVNINTASADELSLLPSVGPTLAQRIVEERQRQGPFADVDELSRTRGIGPSRVEQLRPFIVVVHSNPETQTSP